MNLFEPVAFRDVTARNRIAVSPMCMYSAVEGLGDDFHLQHLGARAYGGAGLVFTEATHVSAEGRITPGCLGLYNDAHQAFLARVAALVTRGGAVPGLQMAHAGRKASVQPPWHASAPIPLDAGGWVPLGASPIAFGDANTPPRELTAAEIGGVLAEFALCARRAREAGFQVIELHAAHGYLIHSFLSPISNHRTDGYGGSLEGRARMLLEAVAAVRSEWPAGLALFVRLSVTDWMQGGLTLDDGIDLARRMRATGLVDLIDCSSGGIAARGPRIPSLHPGYQVPFADTIRREAGIATGAVGMITAPSHAAEIVGNDRADLVFLARALLADPAWPLRAAVELGHAPDLPPQYARAKLS